MQRGLLRKIGVIAGLLAILMTTLAPTISQALAHKLARQSVMESMLASYCSVGSVDTRTHDHHDAPQHTTLSYLQACDYCGLAAHTPTLPAHETGAAIGAMTQRAPAVARRNERPPHAPVIAAQPRAPPAFV